MLHKSLYFKILFVSFGISFCIFESVVLAESTINEQKIAPLNDSTTTTLSPTTTKVPDSKVVPLKPSQNVTPSSTPSLAPEIKIANKTGNFSDSAEDGPEAKWDWTDVDITDDERNKTLLNNSIKQILEDSHEYYNSTTIQNENFTNLHQQSFYADCTNLTINKLLSKSHRRAMTVKLPFEFQFYGHPINNITIATGGFLYAGDYIHSWLAATQYISPLMANFDPSLADDSYVKYCEDDKAFHVYWEKVYLQNKKDVGPFTFSASLYQDGDIVFAYYSLPIPITQIEDDKHPVKVGVSDAYIIDKTVFQARRKTIFEYHRVNFPGPDIRNFTKIKLTPLPTCHTFNDCQSCLENEIKFKCFWCPTLNRCSSGVDRRRQEWANHGCDKSQFNDAKLCAANPDFPVTIKPNTINNSSVTPIVTKDNKALNSKQASLMTQQVHSGTGFVTTLCAIFALVILGICWVFYAYTHPHTSSGQFLIQYRPNAWRWRRGSARYTAATIHM